MPTLNWIGKEKVINHHLNVPFRILEHVYGFKNGVQESKETGSGNKIIHGDNLEALKSLLPEYEGKVKCIYIDPPYNTGNEGWIYNDNVNDPRMKKWLGEVVGRETEDLSRHDKWLCMMYPRLQLLHKLLADDGVIFISIDDNEHTNLKLICDEIFGRRNYVTSLVWRRRASSQMSQNKLSVDHEFVVCYFKDASTKLLGLKKDYKNYSNPDNDPRGPWTLGDLTVGMTKDQRPNQFFELVDPETGNSYAPSAKRVWTFAPDTMKEKLLEKRVVFPKTAKGRPMMKRFLNELKSDINPLSSWMGNDTYPIGLNSEGTKMIQQLFDDKIFDYPKPVSLVELLLSQVLSDGDIVLDSFAGSGTTAHAVMNLNIKDGGQRKFILIEMMDYADSITSERIKRVIKGTAGTQGIKESFDFYELGRPLFLETGDLNEMISKEKVRQYIYYTETKEQLPRTPHTDNEYFLGTRNDTASYLYYEPSEVTTLDYSFLSTMKTKASQYVIYAENCLLPKDFMMQHHIIFKKISRDITRF